MEKLQWFALGFVLAWQLPKIVDSIQEARKIIKDTNERYK